MWSTYLGGSKFDQINALGVDGAGNIYAVGQTLSASGIAAGGVYDGTLNGGADAFVVKFNPEGVRQWGFYLGGMAGLVDEAYAITIRGDRMVIAGSASSAGFGTPGTLQPDLLSEEDGFIVEFNLAGELQWGTYVGGPGKDNAVFSVTIADDGSVYACGQITTGAPLAAGASHQPNYGGGVNDGYLLRLDATGKKVWGTYYGGSQTDDCKSVVHLPGVGVFIAGSTASANNMSTMGKPNNVYGYVARFYENGIRDWGRYVGGSGNGGYTIMVPHPSGGVALMLAALQGGHSTDGTVYKSGGDLLFARLTDAGEIPWATYVGGNDTETPGSLAVAQDGTIFYSASTESWFGLVGPDAYQPSISTNVHGLFGQIDPDGPQAWASYWGGMLLEHRLLATALLEDGSVVVGGVSGSGGLASPGAHQSEYAGAYDGLLGRFAPEKAPLGAPCAAAGECGSSFCVDGVCCDGACGDGDPDDCQACSVARGATGDGMCEPRAIDDECRAASGECDAAEVCDGVGLACPTDAPAPDETPCTTGVCAGGQCVAEGGTSTSTTTTAGTDGTTSGTGASGSSSTGSEPGGDTSVSEPGGDDTSPPSPTTSGEMDPGGVTGGMSSPGGTGEDTGASTSTTDGGNVDGEGGCGGCNVAPGPGLLGLLALALRRRRVRR